MRSGRKLQNQYSIFSKLQGKWEGESAAGLPTATNKGAKIEKNPHYALTISRPCTVFIKVSQLEKENMFKGKQFIYFLLANNKGQRVKKISGDITVCNSGKPTDLITVTNEVFLDSTYSFPTTFSLMVSTTKGGDEGKGSFILKVYSTDANFKLEEMN